MTEPNFEQIGPYTVDREIGRGGMGVVYLGHDTRLDRAVAIKALPEHLAAEPDRLARFEREARTLASLTHPNIAGIYGVEEQEGLKFLVLEYVEGETLAERLDRGPLPLDDAIEIASEIAAGVEAAHEAGVVHRDLKPANIKLTPEGKVKVLDFGLARAEESVSSSGSSRLTAGLTLTTPAHSPTMPGVILGTAAYMSPEQARGRRVDRRTDVWSFGVMLYEMLTGASPFVGETVSDSIGAVLHKEVNLALLPPATPKRVRRVISRCVARDRDQRYHHLGDARLDLLSTDEEGADAPPQQKRSPVLRVATIGVLLGACLAIGWLVGTWGRTESPRSVGRFDVVVETEDGQLSDAEPRIAPDGSRLAFIQNDQVHVRDLHTFESRALPGADDAIDVFWSPDGNWIGYHTKRAIFKVSLSGGDPIKLTDDPLKLSAVTGGGWTSDGRIVYSEDSGIMQVSARGGQPTRMLPVPEELVDYHDVGVVHGTNVLLYILHRRDLSFAVAAFDGTRETIIADIPDSFLSHPAYSPSGHVLFARGIEDQSVWAVAFDIDRMETRGEPFLVERDSWQPSVSADGTLAILRGDTGRSAGALAWVTRDGDFENIEGKHDGIFAPLLSPDATHLAFSAGDGTKFDVWVTDLERAVSSRITFLEGLVAPIGWSPDAREIAVAHFMPAADVPARTLFLHADGSGESRPASDGMIVSFDATWTMAAKIDDPTKTKTEVMAISLDAEPNPTLVATIGTDFRGIAISPDGTLIAYDSDESGESQVYCTRFPDGKGKWQVSSAGGARPCWSADGATLYFESTGEKDGLFETSVTRDPTLQFGVSTQVLDGSALGLEFGRGWSVDPSGERFVVIRAGEEDDDERASISVIQHWFEAYRDR